MAVGNYKAVEQADAKTGANGLANFALTNGPGKKMLIARSGKDVAFLPDDLSWWDGENYGTWRKQAVEDVLNWHVFDDRGMYRPGEEVRVKGWLRKVGAGPRGDVEMAGGVTS